MTRNFRVHVLNNVISRYAFLECRGSSFLWPLHQLGESLRTYLLKTRTSIISHFNLKQKKGINNHNL